MRLLDTRTLEFREFSGDCTERYAILSHTWGDEEVSFDDLARKPSREWLGQRMGGLKILRICRIARARGYELLWVDTCCIDKTSSAELTEAINSMFRWYEKAYVCYTYLSDVDTGSVDSPIVYSEILMASRWFTRGWTLQELLAPTMVLFFDRHWKQIGTKETLSALLSRATHIAEDFLLGLRNASVAQRLSWAARRQTSRPEDRVYSLLGLLEINMPLLYGEGERNAFRRLQLEIIRVCNDQSILAFLSQNGPLSWRLDWLDDVLASQIDMYHGCVNVFSSRPPASQSIVMTQRGLT